LFSQYISQSRNYALLIYSFVTRLSTWSKLGSRWTVVVERTEKHPIASIDFYKVHREISEFQHKLATSAARGSEVLCQQTANGDLRDILGTKRNCLR